MNKAKALFTSCIILSFCFQIFAQPENTIEIKTSIWSGNKYYHEGVRKDKHQVRDILGENQEALNLFNKGVRQQGFSSVFGFVGGFLIGWPIGEAIGGKDANWKLAGIGAGVLLVGIPISSSGGKNIKKGIGLYNDSVGGQVYKTPKKYILKAVLGNGVVGTRLIF